MTIIYRESKGAPLTATEIDGNFHELVQRIEKLENLDTVREDLIHIKQEADELTFISNLGIELGRARLPTLTMTPRGSWLANTQFMNNDIITHDHAAYLCVKSHKSNNFDNDQQYWLKLFSSQHTATNPIQSLSQFPTMTQDSLLKPNFGQLVVYVNEDKPELLLGDLNCWRRVSNGEIFNPES